MGHASPGQAENAGLSGKEMVVKICKTLDHKVMLPANSKTISVVKEEGFIEVNVGEKRYVFPEQDCVILEIEATTAELLASYIHGHIKFSSDYQVKVCVSESAGSTGCYEN